MDSDTSASQLPKAYSPKNVEQRIYNFWEESGYFSPTLKKGRDPFVVIMPPPNVTGELHLGHALVASLSDIMVRWHRMRGDSTLWLPGSDHAGIATQVMVERDLAKEGKTRHDLGREAFLKRVWKWVTLYGSYITQQHRRLGISCDWTRESFTLDPGPSNAVRTTFVNLYRKGLIYHGERIINWCPRCATALSDLEVEHTSKDSWLYYIQYPRQDASGHLTIATTRPETLLGDTAVAVNPSDSRYREIVGSILLLPLSNRPLPIIAHETVDPEFGTGALKVTPGHDPLDFEVGNLHSLPIITVMNLDGTMNGEAGRYEGLERFACRDAIVQDLKTEGLLEKVEPYVHNVGQCQRCGTLVEPLVSKQWFMKMGPLAKPAIEVVRQGQVRIIPDRFTGVYLNWMENIRDWCISRQLWWGHRIPVWYCDICKEITVSLEDPSACSVCGDERLTQDPDVLDTWFSSALWPHSTLGWPKQTEDLHSFYPTSVLETAYEILFFWVARMIMMGLENVGQIPFHTIYLNGLVRDEHGLKMSKTRGNVIDPIEAIDTYGADALRFALVTGNPPGNDSRPSVPKLEASRNFGNKLWNASRFVLMHLEQDPQAILGWSNPNSQHRHDRWILSRLRHIVIRTCHLLEEFQFSEAQRDLHDFVWGEFCDWYIEMAKGRLRVVQNRISPIPTLAYVLEHTLRLLHPFMPFVTEEIWQHLIPLLPREKNLSPSLMIADYPTPPDVPLDVQVEEEIGLVTDIVRAIRNIRAELHIDPSRQLEVYVDAPGSTTMIEEETPTIQQLAKVHTIREYTKEVLEIPSRTMTLVLNRANIIVPVGTIVDLDSERARLQQEQLGLNQTIERLENRLKEGDFLTKAPEQVIERERERLASHLDRSARIRTLLESISQ